MNPLLRNLLIGFGVVTAVVVLTGRTRAQKVADAELGFTPDTGPVGALGATANRILFGLPARFGSFIARTIDPRENQTLDELTGTVKLQPQVQETPNDARP